MTPTALPRSATAPNRAWPLYRSCSGIALDLGSARTRAWVSVRGTILDVPTVAFPGDGDVHPIQRGTIVDTPATARILDRLLRHRLPRFGRRLIVLTTPVLGGVAFRAEARSALETLRPHSVLTVPSARAVATAAGADPTRPLLVVDIGAHVTEAVLLADGSVTDARRTLLGTSDLDSRTPATQIADAVTEMVTLMVEQDRTPQMLDALQRGVLLAGGGALRPDITHGLAKRLHHPVQPVPAPHTAAVRGAAALLDSARIHPSTTACGPPSPRRPH
ncbi:MULTISPECIES: rod shape-determining protein [unclassified Streptomyces]|uniref:rod shape-determining protein n=1 Tax=unclassified Streptomyces TaxID=2593676 RepID=UPI0022536169|nr:MULTISPECIES: rod shape-determining protein [unclassified Streptomyces]MCX5335887.1 rod shape-determining protein [Streptomyces sp. NBC_00140]MCX5366603.1 rod shape-determining protein [Streptomyces sp. NBC_00124]